MDFYSPIFPLIVFIIIYFTVFCVTYRQIEINKAHRETAIDGLRGILALMVLFCHAGCWHIYVSTGVWDYPRPFFFHLGHTGVTLFFMITAFLFASKLLNHAQLPVSWPQLFASRILRIYPLYLAVICLTVLIVFIETGFKLNVSPSILATSIFKWLTFTIFGADIINGYHETSNIIASVQWTLIYECFFYLALPLMGVLFFKNKAYGMATFCTILLVIAVFNTYDIFLPKAFLAGILVAVMHKNLKLHTRLNSPVFGLLAIMLGILQFADFFQLGPKNQERLSIIFLSASFLIIAHGNHLLGLLNSKTMRFLGDISYGIYLIHGLVYFCLYKYIFGLTFIKTASPLLYWLAVCMVTIITVFLANLSYHFIEMPAMKNVKSLATWLKESAQFLRAPAKN